MLLVSMLVACENNNTVCLQDEIDLKPTLDLNDLLILTPVPEIIASPTLVEINGKMIEVSKVVDYPVCNDHWSGVVYVGCDVEIGTSELDEDKNPLFFKDCQLTIEPNTVVYVAAHNDAPYYKGCSCHTGEEPVH
jgi:hypothetical protein